MSRSLLWLMPLLSVAGCQCRLFLAPEDRAPVKVPALLSFPDTFVGTQSVRTLSIANPGKLARTLTVTVDGPFVVEAEVKLAGLETLELPVTFAPTEPAAVKGRLTVRDVEEEQTRLIPLVGNALALPLCRSDDVCRPRTFDLTKGDCVDTVAADGTSCVSPFACFATSSCISGVCRGGAVSCDDNLRCTDDVCGANGCGQVSGVPSCPPATLPCQVPSCSEAQGCLFVPMPDGTACGPRSCGSARVCAAGVCDTVTPAKTQACAQVLVGIAAGQGWADGRGAEARFDTPFALTVEGELASVTDEDVLRRVTLTGEVTTLAGRRNAVLPSAPRDGFGLRARLGAHAGVAHTDVAGRLLLLDDSTLRLTSHGGLVTTLVPTQPSSLSVRDGVGSAATVSGERLVPASAGRVVMAVVDGPCSIGGCAQADAGQLLYRELSARGEVQTLARLPVEALSGWDGPTTQQLSAWSPAVGVVCARASLGTTSKEWRLTATPDGGLREVSDGVCPLREFSRPGSARIEVRAAQLSEVASGVVRWTVDAGPGPVDGPLESAVVFEVKDAELDGDGGLWFIDGRTIRRLHAGRITTLAGPLADRRLLDGTADVARLAGIGGLALTTDAVFFVDSEEKVVRRVAQADSAVRSIGVRPAPSAPRDGALGVASFKAPTAAVLHGGQLLVEDEDATGAHTLRALDPTSLAVVTRQRLPATVVGPLRSSGVALWGRGSATGLRQVLTDGGVEAPVLTSMVVADFAASSGGFVVAGAPGAGQPATQLFRVDVAGAATLLAGRPATDGFEFTPGPALDARLGVLQHVRLGADGTVYWSQADEHAINALSPQGAVRRVVELADRPLDFVVEPSGALLIAVDAAILRLAP